MAPRLNVCVLLAAAVLVLAPSIAAAQESAPRIDFSKLSFAPEPAAPGFAARFDQTSPSPEPSRPSKLLMSLYASTAVTQMLDAHSTMTALNAGAVERNPMMSYLTSHPAAFGAVKAASAAGLIYAGRSLAKRNKTHAIIALVAVNSAYAYVAFHNYRVASQLKVR
jgi:hypothetical protein